ncbi:hypothetical protein GCM10009555_035020 [Acrocarpospora macrocephala]|uniref:Uncharacterized protein n=1 Tax=Acrocarpospora macrocephala TaxID=150177 RepID=A0A5M3WC95_9ACTN|nr:hypothetical protein [Acrocarpospora macrocephala]GES06685.1 hypothetical protein Amac_002800 [Acrocarpospora macrocephala]
MAMAISGGGTRPDVEPDRPMHPGDLRHGDARFGERLDFLTGGLTAEQFSDVFTPTIRNPAKK